VSAAPILCGAAVSLTGHTGQSDDILAVCESGFERDVGKRLLRSGYRLRAQMPAGGYRIERLTMVDLFPQTYHLESVVSLQLGLARPLRVTIPDGS